jgi:cell wall-associated NlpC family hydrolase
MKWLIPFLMFSLLLIGCGPSSPRFASGKNGDQKKEEKKKGAIRFSSKVVEEETREDDKKVDVKAVASRFSSGKTSAPPERTPPVKDDIKKPEPVQPGGKFENQKMMDLILTWMGTPYDYGGETRSGTDCSGFTMQMFRQSAGISLPRTTEEQVKLGSPVQRDNLKFGDLIFFNTTGQNPSHVGIYIGDDMFAHASVSFGVTLSSMYSSYYKKRYTEARRIIN